MLERLARLEEENKRLLEENRRLKERLGLNSSNSSMPPSSDTPGSPRQRKKPTGRNPGGQPGNKKHERALLPPEQVQRVVEMVPKKGGGCQRPLKGEDSAHRRHPMVEVPPLSAVVTECRCHALQCAGYGVVTRGEVPGHARSVFGDRLAALASLRVGKYRLSKRLVKDALSDMLGVELSVGSVSNLEAEMSQALAPAAAEALACVQEEEAVNADETGFVQGREDSCPDTTQDSLPAAGDLLCRTGFEPAWSLVRFPLRLSLPHRFLLTQAWPGALNGYFE